MTSRERVLRAVEFGTPDRVPRDLWAMPGATLRHGEAAMSAFRARWPGDLTQVTAGKPKSLLARGNPYDAGESRDEWGCVFQNLMPGVHGEVKDPLFADWSRLGEFHGPEEMLAVDLDAANAFCRASDKFVFASGWARLFERIQFLRGTENVFMDLAEGSSELMLLLDKVHAFNCRQFEVWAKSRADALVIMDDWGSQQSLLISPTQWREVFKPCYAEYSRIAHGAGKKLFMHSDGYIFDIYPDLIEIGVDAINSQLFCMDIEAIGRQFGGKITFWGELDRQNILPHGTPADVRKAVERVRAAVERPGGGVIAQFELSGDTPIPNADAAYEAWL